MAYNLNEQYRRYLRNEMTETELQDFLAEAAHPENEEMVKEWMDGEWVEIAGLALPPASSRAPRVFKIWRRMAAAAVFIGLLVVGYWLLFERKATVDVPQTTVAVTKDVEAPKTANAVITLANGEQIILDSMGNGTLATQGNVNVMKLADGQIVYSSESDPDSYREGSQEIQYNTLTNPRGSKVVNLTLSDGSKVWLNAESSLRYPIVFGGSERKVEITGEAYFEVAPSNSPGGGEYGKIPFIVQKGEILVQVLGTQFNVNTYEDETSIKVTLLEGSVRTSIVNGGSSMLKPGEQAQLDKANSFSIRVIRDIDIDEVMAWKNGRFHFNKADIKTIMKEISRWYDVDIVYTAEVKEHFRLKTSRNTSVSNIFKILETTGGVHLEVEGRKIIVKP